MTTNSLPIRQALIDFGIPYMVKRTAMGDVVTAPSLDGGENITTALWASRVGAVVLPIDGLAFEIIPA